MASGDKMREEEVKYVLRLLDDLSPVVFEEIIHFFYDIEESKPSKDISDETLAFLKQNLISNPVTTSTILRYLQAHVSENKLNASKIQTLYLEVLKNELSTPESIDKAITLMSLVKWEDQFIPQFIQQVLKLVSDDTYRQYRKQILISLVPQERPQLLKVTSEFIQQNEPQKEFKLTTEYMLELCYQDKTHWLLKAAQVYKHQLHDMKNVTFKINNFTKQILIMVLIDLTNSPETYDLPSLVHQLTNIFSILDTYSTADEQLQFYITEVKRELTIIKFCLENNCKIMTTSIFNQALTQSALALISQACRLPKVDRYKVSRLLNTNNDIITELMGLQGSTKRLKGDNNLNWDIVTYNSYCAITKIIDTILNAAEGREDAVEITSSLDEVKRIVLSIQPMQYCIEVIENIFACLFLRYEFLSCQEHLQEFPCGTHSDCSYFYSKKQVKNPKGSKSPTTGFMCNALTMQIILNTLKLCLEALEDNIDKETTDSVVISRLKQLVKVVNHSLWKLQLVSTLPPDTGPLQLKLCLDYVEVDESSEEEDRELDVKSSRKKIRVRRRHTNPKPDVDQVMLASTISANEDACNTTRGNIDFISVMLAKPNSLVALALYHNDFSKANQIIEMFDLADAEIATEVSFTEQLRHLVAKIKNIIYYKDDTPYATKELSALSVVSTEVMGLVEGFLASNRPPNFSFDVIQLAACHPHLQLYSHQNASFINAVDILLSSGLNREITYGLINVVERKLAEVRCSTDVAAVKKINYIRFIEDIASVTFEIFGNTEKSFDFVDNVCGLIADCRIPIKHKEFCKMNQLSKELRQCCEDLADVVNPSKSKSLDQNLLQKYHQIYMNIVAASDKDLCNIGEVCRHGNRKTRIHYLRMCYMYCKTVSQLEQEENNSAAPLDSSYFTVLDKQLHDIFGTMINAKEIPVTYLEPICKKLNVNLIPKLILNFCPSITLMDPHTEASEMNFSNLLQSVYDFKNTEENLFLEPETNLAPLPRAPTPQCLTYIVLHNWVLAHLIKKIHTSPNENTLQQSMDARTRCLNNYMELERFNCTKVLFGGNKYLASLHTTIDLDKLFLYLPKLIESGKLLKCLNIIDSLSERQILCSANLMNLRDLILFKLAINPKIESNWKYCQYLKCSELKVNLILNHLSSWPAEGAMEVLDYLRFLLDQEALDEDLHEKCSNWMIKIPLYHQIATIMGCSHWYSVYEKSVDNPENVIEVLMDSQQFQLCLDWADVHNVSEHMKNLIVMNLLRQLFEYTNQATPAVIAELLSRLPTSQAMDLIHEEMAKVRNVEILQVCVDFVSENSSDWKSFENIKIGLQIMLEIDTNLRQIFWDLIEKPLLMIEQFMMNAKLDILSLIISKISSNLKKDPTGDNLYYNIKLIDSVVISRNAVDALLRFYAEKALDMNPKNTCPMPPKPSEDSLMQSIDSINIEAASRPFVMPEQVPSKEQWAEDYSTDRCMVCHTSIFSMIIRRHHCRRCGRLVCHVCSRNRMQVPTYPSSVKFRVCNDCYTQTTNRKTSSDQDHMMLSSNSDSAGSGVTCMDWCLSTNSSRNEAVRTEFSFEFTPNVTLCLTIMKMHSINLDYPRFLLDRSDEIARALSGGGDARLLVRARRSLLLAAAELYSRAPHEIAGCGRGRVAETGAAHAARCLAHADAMATLVQHQAHALLPRQGAHPSQYTHLGRVAETGAAHAARCLAHADAMATLVQHQAHALLPRQGAHPSQYTHLGRVAETGAAHAARCLAHADAMATLVQHQAHALLPRQGAHPSQYTHLGRVAETGAAHAARCLAHADAMATLVQHQAHALLPRQGAHPSQYTHLGRVAETGAAHAARCLAHADAMATLVQHQAHALLPRQGAHPSQYTHLGRVAETGAAHAARCLAHADAMATLVQHQAHALLPRQGAHPSQIVRSLLEAEKWELALEIATKSGIPRNSVLAAWGKACLKAGCFKQAREKFAHCFKNTINICMEVAEDCEYGREASESQFVNRRLHGLRQSERTSSVSSTQSDGRPRSNPPLLNEIISMLEDINYPVNQQILHKAETMKSTNEKLASLNASKKRIQVTEPALNIMHTLASVKKIKQGDYTDFQTATVPPKKSLAQGLLRRNNNHEPKVDYLHKKLDPFFYRECVYYLSNYGSHVANIAFYMKYKNMSEVLTYCYENLVDKETFTESVYMECLKKDKVNELLKAMSDVDSTLEMWSEYIMHICRTLEASKRLEALYALQCGSGQHARASATCALLYARPVPPAAPLAALHARRDTLAAALHHLAQCPPTARKTNDPKSIQFHLDKVTIDNLMTTMSRQMELAKYLAANEAAGRLTLTVIDEVIPVGARRDPAAAEWRPLTLFGSNTDKIRLVALVLATGESVKDGFEFAFKIIKEHRLDSMNIYTHVAKYLVNTDRFMEVKTLAKCIRESKETASSLMSDQVLEWGVGAVVARCEARGQLHDEQAELLIHHVSSLTIKISCYLACRNVSSAYILAARHERANELRRVLHEAERLGHEQIRNACLKRLTSKNVL